jgi:N-methylhydantoinase A/oxoprolinase/acetone carboxylase beta subunit
VVDATMVQALRRVSVQRGVDPAGLALVAFGGAGPLHACELARQLGAACVIVPPAAGVLSAVGLLTSPRRRELVRTWPTPGDHRGLEEAAADLVEAAREVVAASGVVEEWTVELRFDCRYPGQSHELQVPTVEGFHDEHRRRNGYARVDDEVEVTALRAAASAPAPSRVEEVLGAWEGRVEPVVGPAVVARDDCTIWVPEGWRGEPGALGALVLRR